MDTDDPLADWGYQTDVPPMTARQAGSLALTGVGLLLVALLLNLGWQAANLPVLDEPVRTSVSQP